MISESQVERASTALLKYLTNKQSVDLLHKDDIINLQFTTKRMNLNQNVVKPRLIPLPNRIYAKPEICIFVKDPQRKVKDICEELGLSVKVIGVDKLRKKYRPFEAKRILVDSFDLFLADEAIIPMLPKLLGKAFFKKKKQPIPITIDEKLDKTIERCMQGTTMLPTKGTCLSVKIGNSSFSAEELTKNVVEAVEAIVERIPKKWDNVQAIYLKGVDSVSLPIFQGAPVDVNVIED